MCVYALVLPHTRIRACQRTLRSAWPQNGSLTATLSQLTLHDRSPDGHTKMYSLSVNIHTLTPTRDKNGYDSGSQTHSTLILSSALSRYDTHLIAIVYIRVCVYMR